MAELSTERNRALVMASLILALGLVTGGYLMGDGLRRAKYAERIVTVRGLAERDVTADLATWTIGFSATGGDLATLQQKSDADATAITAFLKRHGFTDSEIAPRGVSVNQWMDNGRANITLRQRIQLRTTNIAVARKAHAAQAELVRQGVAIEEGGNAMVYSFTRLNAIKPAMIAEATKDARAGAEQFAMDSGASVGGIKSAAQGYFSIGSRDGDAAGAGNESPDQKVRVVTTVDFYLE